MSRIRLIMLAALAVFAFSAVASASASAFELKWKVNGAEASGQQVSSSGGEFKLAAGTKTITCTSVTDTGNAEASGKGKAKEIKFTGCKPGQSGCNVKSEGQSNGTIVVSEIPTQLVEREPSGGGAKKEADNFEAKMNAKGEKEFVTLKFEAEAGKSCSEYPETKVKGSVAGETINSGGAVELNFPNPELKGNTLEAFGVAAKLTGKDTLKITGSTLEAK